LTNRQQHGAAETDEGGLC